MPDGAAPLRRDLHFPLDPARTCDWHPEGPAVSLFLGTLSVFFPDGERFFIHSVRHYRDRIHEPGLKAAVTEFIGQEAMHGREHERYNQLLHDAGLPVRRQAAWSLKLLRFAQRHFSPAFQLAITIALEHLTAILANNLLSRPQLLRDGDPDYRALWTWHALEETEHKSVAFDVYQTVAGTSLWAWARRSLALLMVSFDFTMYQYGFWIQNVRKAGHGRDWRGWWRAFRWLWLGPGAIRRILPDWLRWFRPGFHPWDVDNRRFLGRLSSIESTYAVH